MARVPTERVTVRLNKAHLATIDALIQVGQVRNRTQAVAEAVRDYVNAKSVAVKQVVQQTKSQFDLQNLAAQLAEMQAKIAKLAKK